MKKQIPALVLSALSIALAVALHAAHRRIDQLEQQLHRPPVSPEPVKNEPDESGPALLERVSAETRTQPLSSQSSSELQPALPVSEGAENQDTFSGQRMMKNLAGMLDNPTMNKMLEASQRGTLGAMYDDLIQRFNLNPEEQEYFMDLLMFRQMTQVNFGMKMMSGTLSEEEKQSMLAEVKDADELLKSEMKNFLNSDEDYREFEFFEQTMAERMMLSQAEAELDGTPAEFSDATRRSLLEMMHEEKENFDFSSGFEDQTDMDLSPKRFSKENIRKFSSDLDRLNQTVFEKAQNMLSAEQLDAFKKAVTSMAEMQKSQLEMTAQMISGGQTDTP